MSLPQQLLVRDLLKRRVRCSQGLDRGAGLAVWMHPPVHRVLGWVTRPDLFGERRLVWRLDQLRDLGELEALVKGEPAGTDSDTILRLPTLFEADLLDRQQDPIGTVVDAAVELRSGRILEYLVSRSDPRLPGSSRWRLNPERIVDQQPGCVFTQLEGLDDLPLARASVRQEFLRRSRRWRDQMQDAGNRLEQRMEGWLEEPPWDGPADRSPDRVEETDAVEPWDDRWDDRSAEPPERRSPRRAPGDDDDPWI
ncbi:MAG: RNA methyltransferase [Cyanobacteriota bacterium]|nr:RNA methyltransferase [Cyanobacteriota bacterium]